MSPAPRRPAPEHPLAVVVMGVSGCGKSTVGSVLAAKLGARFVDADDLHSEEARSKMATGRPLSDDDRWPWLRRVGATIAAEIDAGGSTVVACSALRRVYRDAIRDAARAQVVFAHLHGTRELLEARLRSRTGHFMPAKLLGSQLDLLELPAADESAIEIDIADLPEVAADRVIIALAHRNEATTLPPELRR